MLIPKRSTTDFFFLSSMAWFQSCGYLRDAWTPLEFLWWLVRRKGKLAYCTTYKWLGLWQEQLRFSWTGLVKAGSSVVSVLCQPVCAWRQWIRSDVCECQMSLQCLAWDVCLPLLGGFSFCTRLTYVIPIYWFSSSSENPSEISVMLHTSVWSCSLMSA